MNNIKIVKRQSWGPDVELNYKYFTFSGGEVSIKLDVGNYRFFESKAPVKLIARIQNSNDFFALANIKNALEELGEKDIQLFIPYLSYSRQDRCCAAGESFSLKVFADLLNSLNFTKITTLDCHSDVGPAVIDNIKNIKQLDVIAKTPINEYFCQQKNLIFVSPDVGANKKTSELAKYFMHEKFIRADKLRDLNTGKILETIVYADDLSGCTVAICDDLIDGGFTFTELARVLKSKGAEKIILYTTHAIFSKGVVPLFESGINEIVVTNSFKTDYPKDEPRLKVFDIEGLVK